VLAPQENANRELDVQSVVVAMNKEKERLQAQIRDQAHTIHQLTLQCEAMGGPSSPQVRIPEHPMPCLPSPMLYHALVQKCFEG
jgi:hypothetical protein